MFFRISVFFRIKANQKIKYPWHTKQITNTFKNPDIRPRPIHTRSLVTTKDTTQRKNV